MSNQTLKSDFIKILDNLDRSKSRGENFRNFCEMSYCALAKTTAQNEVEAEAFEERYMSIVGTYNDKDDVRKMPEMLSLIMLALDKGGCDFLGEIAGEIGALDKRNGQFFTPYDISKLMASITIPSIAEIIKEDGFFSLSDPAAGAGCMVLAAADVVQDQGFDPSDYMSVQVVEINKLTYYMLFIQLAMRGIAAEVIHGNSLSLEVFESACTPAAIYFFGKHGCMFKRSKNEDRALKPDVEITPILNAQQLDLFGK